LEISLVKGTLTSRPLRVVAVISVLLTFLVTPTTQAHLENGTFTESFKIASLKILSKGPYKPGDVIVFSVDSNLPIRQRQWIQVTADCLTYPAEWHSGTEESFLVEKFAKRAQATAVISSGCSSGVQKVTEVMLADVQNNYTRVTTEDATLPTFVVTKGHLRANATSVSLKKDSIAKLRIPQQVRLKRNSKQTTFLTLPRITDGGQTLDWVATGECGITRTTGATDLGGALWASGPSVCALALNTPWGSNLYQALNQAFSIEVFPATALSCQSKSNKKIKYVNSARCPKGFQETK